MKLNIFQIFQIVRLIFFWNIPISDGMKDISILFKNKKKFWEFVLNNGEDYQLLFSVRKKKKHLLKKKKSKILKR